MSWANQKNSPQTQFGPPNPNDQQHKPHLWNRNKTTNAFPQQPNPTNNWNTNPTLTKTNNNITTFQQPQTASAYFANNNNVLNSKQPSPKIMATPQQQPVDTNFKNNNEGWSDWGTDWSTENNNMSQQSYTQQQQPNYGHPQQTPYAAPPQQSFNYGQQSQQNFVSPPAMQQQQPITGFPPTNVNAPLPPPQGVAQNYNQQPSFNAYQPNYAPPTNFAQPNTSFISDSFAADDNWNWNVEATPPAVQQQNQPQFPKVQKQDFSRKISNASIETSMENYQQQPSFENQQITRIPDIPVNTQQQQPQPPKPMPQMARVLKSETLTPQWSIESQSSDPSIDSENLESRSSNTVTSDEAGNIPSVTTYVENRINYVPQQQQFSYTQVESNQTAAAPLITGDMDQLDAALQAINLGQPPVQQNFQNYYNQPTGFTASPQQTVASDVQTGETQYNQNIPTNNYQENESVNQQNLPLPPPPATKDQSFSAVQQEPMFPPQSQIPPPLSQPIKYPSPAPSPANSNLMTNSRPPSTPSSASSLQFSAPPSVTAKIGGPPPPSSGNGRPSGNPYKRSGTATHHTMAPFQAPPPVANNLKPTTDFFQQRSQDMINHESFMPDNSELPENLENFPPNQDRNQYLQTGHLSEEGGYSAQQQQHQSTNYSFDGGAENSDNLPPPGASRLVPVGQPEPNNQQSYNSLQEPPPGLDRLIPGTELPNNMERQADGQVSTEVPQVQRIFSAPLTSSAQAMMPSNQMEIHDRNLYLVAGESNDQQQQSQQQRVIPGVEDEENSTTNFVQPHHLQSNIPMSEQQRELVMDGENLEDQVEQQQLVRDEQLIEGENTLDDVAPPPQNQGVGAAITVGDDSESNITMENNKKDSVSIPSTLEDSDRDRTNHYNKSLAQRRGEDKRGKPTRNSREKYDSEDSEDSDREKRSFRREGSNRDTRKEPRTEEGDKEERRRGDRKGDRTRDGRDYREDDRERATGKAGRDKDRSYGRHDRYGREYRDRDRYETDGSKYETERSSKYDDGSSRRREERRAPDEGSKRKERRPDDRYYDKDDRRRDDRYRSERKRGDRTRRHEYDEDYQRSSSRNASDRERDIGRSSRDRELREKERSKYAQSAGYYQQPGYAGVGTSAYDAYTYYQQHQQYFETLRRTNPQAYSEWYRTYYGQMQAAQLQQQQQRDLLSTTDGRESVPSGRSSVNDKDRYNRPQHFYNPDYHRQYNNHSLNSTMLDNHHSNSMMSNDHHLSLLTYQQQQQRLQKVASTEVLYAASLGGGDRSYYSENDYYNQRTGKVDNQQQRMTPCKFTTSHSMANWQNGLMALVKPRYSSNGFTDVVKIINMGVNDSTRKLFTSYPGPLIRNVTHKKSIIEFCEEQIRQGPQNSQGVVKSRGNSLSSLYSAGQPNRGSFTLVWDYLILLLRQNGTFVGTDISELLMKNKLEYPYDTPINTQNQSSRRTSVDHDTKAALPTDDVDADKILDNGEENELSKEITESKNEDTTDEDVEDLSKEGSQLSEKEITDKFRNYLLYGNIADALEWATDNNLWGHALFLASKVDRRQHANVMMKFANKLTLNDPLQTLYQLMSGRSPNSVTSIVDEKWGDWRPHLAMILSNTSEKVELSRKAITTLGDSLYNRGDLFGAQFCYLVADISFGKWSNVNQETMMISNSSSAIRLVLLGASQHKCFREFATNEAIVMTEIYEYARTLNEEKFTILDFQPYKYLLATRMLDYGLQLKSLLYMEQIASKIQKDPSIYEPSFIQKIYALGDRLKYFDPVIEKIIDESILDNNNSITGNIYQSVEDQKWLQDLATVLRQYNSGALTYEPISIQNSLIDQTQSTPLSMTSGGFVTSNGIDSKSQIDKQFVEITNQFNELTTQYDNAYTQDPLVQQPAAVSMHYGGENQTSDQQTNYQENAQQPFIQTPSYYGQQPVADYNSEQQQQPAQYDNNQMSYGHNDYNYGEQQSVTQTDGYAQQPNYDSWNAQNTELPKPTISMPNSVSQKAGFYDDESSHPGGNKANEKTEKSGGNDGKKQAAAKDGAGKGTIGVSGPNSSGWFGGIFNKFSLKPKNQMILPDDKNPSIVWDPDKKKWVNTDGEVAEQESFKPPPKMMQPPGQMMAAMPSQLTPPVEPQYQQQQQQPQFPSNPSVTSQMPAGPLSASGASQPQMPTGEPAKVPSLQSNMLRMQRKRTLKNSYVDVFNPSGAPAKPIEPILAPSLPQTTQVPTQGYFIPAQAASPSEQQLEGAPQFYNPNQYGGYQQ